MYQPLWAQFDRVTRENVQSRNYERLFDHARSRVRALERTQDSTQAFREKK